MKQRINFKMRSFLLIGSCLLIISSCKKDDDPAPIEQPDVIVYDTIVAPPNMVFDASGNLYSTVVIGDQRWMSENLKTTRFSNGDPIDYLPNASEWSSTITAAWSYYNNDAVIGEIHGKLYNYFSITDPRNVCPTGWHVPSDEEWIELELALGIPQAELYLTNSRGADENVGGQMKSNSLWDEPNTGANNNSGFFGFPSGSRIPSGGTYSELGKRSNWWSGSEVENNTDLVWIRQLKYNDAGIFRLNIYKPTGCAIRCVQD